MNGAGDGEDGVDTAQMGGDNDDGKPGGASYFRRRLVGRALTRSQARDAKMDRGTGMGW